MASVIARPPVVAYDPGELSIRDLVGLRFYPQGDDMAIDPDQEPINLALQTALADLTTVVEQLAARVTALEAGGVSPAVIYPDRVTEHYADGRVLVYEVQP